MSTDHLVHTLRAQGQFCGASGSPMYDELFELVAKDVEAGGVFATILSGHEDDPSRQAVPLRLLGGLHRLALDGRAPTLRRFYPSTGGTWDAAAAWPEIVLTARDRMDDLRAALNQPPQTNEVGRSAVLIGGLLFLDSPIRFAGAAFRDRHECRTEPAPGALPLWLSRWPVGTCRLAGDDRRRVARPLPPPDGAVRIVERHGYDIAPIDVTGTDGEMTVLSYVWPDQSARLERLRGAIAVARNVPARLHRVRAADAVAGMTLADGALTVLWHSITWQYLSDDERAAIRDGVDALAAQADSSAPFAHLTLEPARDGDALKFLARARSWPGGELQVLGECHPHGPPVNWQ